MHFNFILHALKIGSSSNTILRLFIQCLFLSFLELLQMVTPGLESLGILSKFGIFQEIHPYSGITCGETLKAVENVLRGHRNLPYICLYRMGSMDQHPYIQDLVCSDYWDELEDSELGEIYRVLGYVERFWFIQIYSVEIADLRLMMGSKNLC